MKKPCIVIAGPTAVGKSDIAVKLCSLVNGSVISADSMQIYKGMDIGSAKVTAEEMCGVDHYLIDQLDPKDEFNVYRFKKMAEEAMEEIWAKDRVPVVTGGTGFYIQALVRDVEFSDTSSSEVFRKECENIVRDKGPLALHDMLKEKDPDSAAAIHPNNVKRVTRALEYLFETGSLISEHNTEQRARTSPYLLGYFVINDDRQVLYERINRRVDKMISEGLEKEVEMLYNKGLTADDTSMKGIGYREFFPYFEGKISLEECIESIKTDTRHFAKRQLTWFKREKDAIWIDRRDYENDNDKIAAAVADKWKELKDDDNNEDI